MTRRVMQVVLSLQPGGTERLVVELSRRLHGSHAMPVCCLDEAGAWATELEREGIPVVSIGRGPGFRPEIGQRIARVATEHGIDLLHCHHYSPFIYGTIARARRSLSMVFTEHGRLSDAPPSRKRWLANQVFGRIPARIFAVSGDLRRHMVAEGFDPSRIGVIYNGIELRAAADESSRIRARELLGAVPGERLIGAVGRLDPVKDLGTLLEALHQIATIVPSARVVFIGDGPCRAELEARTAQLNLASRVTFLGYRNDVRELLPGLDVYANTSIFEGVSLTILEAMATALPVLATRVGGTPEVVEDGTSGVLVSARDSKAVATALEALLASDVTRSRLGLAARSRVGQQFTIERMVADYAAVYNGRETDACVA
jgi:L-malate glycosyltransferase